MLLLFCGFLGFTIIVKNRKVYKVQFIRITMEVKPILRRKFIGDIPEEEMQLIERACQIEKRNRISLIRKATVDYAKKIIKQNRENEKELGDKNATTN